MIAAILAYLKGKWWVIALGLLVVPYLAYQNMKDRKAKELAESTYPIDDRIDSLKLIVNRDGVSVSYQDGTVKPADGIGITAVTVDDHKKNPDLLKAQELKDDDFPVVVFINQTGFDASGTPLMVRRARDGMQVFPKNGTGVYGKRLRAAVPLRSGGWTGYYWETADKTGKMVISDEDWTKVYLGIPEAPKPPSAEELDKMTDEQLKALGIRRVPPKEGPKEDPKQPEQVKEQVKEKQDGKTGLRGHCVVVGGNPAIVPLRAKVVIFKGAVKPFDKLERAGPTVQVAALVDADAEGKYRAELPPGKYTVTVEVNGQLYGNAVKQDRWPTVDVKDGWADYDFRKGK